MGKVISFEQMLAARFRKQNAEGQALSAKDKNAMADRSGVVVLAAAKQEDARFLSGVDAQNTGIKILRGNPRFQFLQAVFDEKLDRFFVTKIQNHLQDNLNDRWYWTFPDRPGRAYFVSPAHVCRTHLMAVALWKNNGVDFKRPDSEGHLPLYFLARYAKDKYVIPALTAHFNLNANDSGRNILTREKFEAPLIRAIKYANTYAVHSLEQLSPHNADLNRRADLGLTPLMLAVLYAEEALNTYARGETPGHDVKKRLWIVRFLAASLSTDHDLTDPTGFKAADYAVSPRTQAALAAGIAKKDAFIRRFMPGPKPGI
jgi:hypothetical protein